MPRYVAFLRGVSPQNLAMSDLRAVLEAARFTDVRTILSSGNAAFTSALKDESAVERAAERAMQKLLGRVFYTIVRPSEYLHDLLADDRYAQHDVAASAKRVVSFFRDIPTPTVPLPLSRDGASVLLVRDREAYTAYTPSPKGPVFMTLIERAFGTNVTTRTLDTVAKCARA